MFLLLVELLSAAPSLPEQVAHADDVRAESHASLAEVEALLAGARRIGDTRGAACLEVKVPGLRALAEVADLSHAWLLAALGAEDAAAISRESSRLGVVQSRSRDLRALARACVGLGDTSRDIAGAPEAVVLLESEPASPEPELPEGPGCGSCF